MKLAFVITVLFHATFAFAQVGSFRIYDANLESDVGSLADGLPDGAALIVRDAPAKFALPRLFLANGDALAGRLAAVSEEAVAIETRDFGRVEVPLEEAVAYAAAGVRRDPAWRADRPAGDVVELGNGDVVQGFVAGLEADALSVDADGGGAVNVPLDAVRLVRFADVGGADEAEPPPLRVLLDDGTEVGVESLAVADDQITLTRDGQDVTLPAARLLAAERPGVAAFLADAAPAEASHEPYFTATFPPAQSAGLAGFFAGDLPGRSIRVRSRTGLTFDVPPGDWTRLRLGYRVDDSAGPMPLADADVRVLLDGEVAHERRNLTAADGPQSLDLPLGGAETVTLAVDYGNGTDAQDVVLWTLPALVGGD